MLGRTANDLFWMSRYIERAENIARLLEVGYRIALLPHEGAGQDDRQRDVQCEQQALVAEHQDDVDAERPGRAGRLGPHGLRRLAVRFDVVCGHARTGPGEPVPEAAGKLVVAPLIVTCTGQRWRRMIASGFLAAGTLGRRVRPLAAVIQPTTTAEGTAVRGRSDSLSTA